MLKLRPMLFTSLRCSWCSSLPLPLSFTTNPSSSSSSLHYSPWSGFQNWRASPLNKNRLWGPNGPEPLPASPFEDCEGRMALASSLAEMGALVLSTGDPLTKSKLSHLAYSRWRTEHLPIGDSQAPDRPARPNRPQLVSFLTFKNPY